MHRWNKTNIHRFTHRQILTRIAQLSDTSADIVKVANKSDLNSWGKSWNLRLSQDLASALAEVVTFLAKSCSCDVDFSKADIDNEDVEGIVKEVVTGAIRGQGQATSEDPFGKKNKQCRQFKINYELVWDIIVREIYSKAQSTSALLILVKYAVAFSQYVLLVQFTVVKTFFLKDTYLKYLGWSLNDKVASVRIAALTALQKLYDMEQNHTPLDTFTTRFKTRILEMTCDICPAVGVKALGVLTRLIREELVEVTDCDRGFLLLIDDSPQLRLAAAELVTALDWRNILRVLLTGDEQLSEADKTNLVFIFSRCVRKGTGESLVPGMNDKKPLTKTQK
eukprot:gene22330-26937_t